MTSLDIDLPFTKRTLANGLDVIVHEDRHVPIVAVNVWYHVGSKNERPGRTGFAHLFEHLMFEGSEHYNAGYFPPLQQAGALLNGSTNADRTNYWEVMPSSALELALWMESDRMGYLLPALTDAKFSNQRDVVLNERRQSDENRPYAMVMMALSAALYPPDHPYSWMTIGSAEDIRAMQFEDVQEFFRTYYSPNNLSLVVAGDFDPAEAKRWIEKYFGPIPPGPALARPTRWVPTLAGEKVLEIADRVPQERVYVVFPSAAYYEPGDAEMDLAARIIADGISSRLQRALIYDKPLASSISAFQFSQEIASAFVVIGTARPGVDLVEVERGIAAEIARLAKEGPTAAELSRARTKQEFEYVSGLERIGGFGGKADLLNPLGDPVV